MGSMGETGQGQALALDFRQRLSARKFLKGRGINSRRPKGGFSPQVKVFFPKAGVTLVFSGSCN